MANVSYIMEFQSYLRTEIEKYIIDKWNLGNIEVTGQDNKPGVFNRFLDISIRDKDKDSGIVLIKIEYRSNFYECRDDIEKLKTWISSSTYAAGAMMQIMLDESSLTSREIGRLVEFSRVNNKPEHVFLYDYFSSPFSYELVKDDLAKKIIESTDFMDKIRNLINIAIK